MLNSKEFCKFYQLKYKTAKEFGKQKIIQKVYIPKSFPKRLGKTIFLKYELQ